MTSLVTASHWSHARSMRYRLSDGGDIVYHHEFLHLSTALEHALAAAAQTAAKDALILQVRGTEHWRALGTLGQLEQITWVTFEVDHSPTSQPHATEYVSNRVRGQLDIQKSLSRTEYLSVLFPHRDDARIALARAETAYPGLTWTEHAG